jgi:cyclophilin family peptidyl-prolyl cis-trans isomerase
VQVFAAFALEESTHMRLRKAPATVGSGATENNKHRLLSTIAVSLVAGLLTACGATQEGNVASKPAASKPASSGKPNRTAVIETGAGTIKFELLEDQAPKTAENFRLLAERGYYNGTIFHRVVSGFMIQGGDPNGDGTGGQTATGALLPNEINRSSALYQGGYRRGLVAMANKGTPETGSSQFFIMHGDRSLSQLRPDYTVFGRVIEGMNVVDQIATAPTTMANGEKSRPVTPVKVKKVYVQ